MKRITGALVATSLLATAGCYNVYRYQYLSLEDTAGAVVVKTAPATLERSVLLPTIPVEYSVVRPEYTLRVLVDETTSWENATIEIQDGQGMRIEQRLKRTGSGCGSIDSSRFPLTPQGRQESPTKFTFLWITCRSWEPWEQVIAFDVVDGTGRIVEDQVTFDIKRQGLYLLPFSL